MVRHPGIAFGLFGAGQAAVMDAEPVEQGFGHQPANRGAGAKNPRARTGRRGSMPTSPRGEASAG